MSDLISRSKLLKAFNNKNIQITFDLPVEEVLGEDVDLDDFAMLVQDAIHVYKKMVIDTIQNQPTAYDIDKVVEEMEQLKNKGSVTKTEKLITNACVNNAIEIVKQGSVSDDVCEWNSVSDGDFIQNPHTKRLYSNEPSMNNIFCNTCGKKIRVVW